MTLNEITVGIFTFYQRSIVEISSLLQKLPPELFYEKDYLRNFVKFTEKHLCQCLFHNKVAGVRPETLLKM